jgi:uncharacterized protein HemX
MPDGRPLIPRIRMPRVTLPGRASRAASEETTASEARTEPQTATKAGSGTPPTEANETKAPAAKAAAETAAAPTAAPNLQERIEGLQGWMAELERKQARTTYFGAIAVLIAIAAAGAALYFGITTKDDSATKGDVDGLKSRVDALQSAVTKNSKNTQDTINNSIAQLQGSIQALQKQQAQNAANISTLQSQAAAGAFNSKGAAAGTPATPTTPGAATPTTPGATTTTPKKP